MISERHRSKLVLVILLFVISGILLFLQTVKAQSLSFDGTNDYVDFGTALELATQNFTVEIWFMRTGSGISWITDTTGVPDMIPLVSKGAPQAEGSNVDANYILGIKNSSSVLVADFEEGTGSPNAGLNHPLYGVTPIELNIWYHAAVTFDNGEFKLYLNGSLDGRLNLGSNTWPQGTSIQKAGLATMLDSNNPPTAYGFFAGVLDEARIWDHALTQQEIRDNMFLEITSASGLLGRWGLNEGSGTTADNSVYGGSDGTLTNGPTWVSGFPFTATSPTAPTSLSATVISCSQIQL